MRKRKQCDSDQDGASKADECNATVLSELTWATQAGPRLTCVGRAWHEADTNLPLATYARLFTSRAFRAITVSLGNHSDTESFAALQDFVGTLSSSLRSVTLKPHVHLSPTATAKFLAAVAPQVRELTIEPFSRNKGGLSFATDALADWPRLTALCVHARGSSLQSAALLISGASQLTSLILHLTSTKFARSADDALAPAIERVCGTLRVLKLHIEIRGDGGGQDWRDSQWPLTTRALATCRALDELQVVTPSKTLAESALRLWEGNADDDGAFPDLARLSVGDENRLSAAFPTARFRSECGRRLGTLLSFQASLLTVGDDRDMRSSLIGRAGGARDARVLFPQLARIPRLALAFDITPSWIGAALPLLLTSHVTSLSTLTIDVRETDDRYAGSAWAPFLVDGLGSNTSLRSLVIRFASNPSSMYMRKAMGDSLLAGLMVNKTLKRLEVDTSAFGLDWLNGLASFAAETSGLREICLGGPATLSYDKIVDEAHKKKPIEALMASALPLTSFSCEMPDVDHAIDLDLLTALRGSSTLTAFYLIGLPGAIFSIRDDVYLFSSFCRLLASHSTLRHLRLEMEHDRRYLNDNTMYASIVQNGTLLDLNGTRILENVAIDQRLTRNWAEVAVTTAFYRANLASWSIAHSISQLIGDIAQRADFVSLPSANAVCLARFVDTKFFHSVIHS